MPMTIHGGTPRFPLPFAPGVSTPGRTLSEHLADRDDPHLTLRLAKQVRVVSALPGSSAGFNEGDVVFVVSTGRAYYVAAGGALAALPMAADAGLLPVATASSPGVVKAGPGTSVAPDGTLSVVHQSLAGCVTGGSYDSAGRKIQLKHGDAVLAEIDASAFVKDGMVSSVEVKDGNLVIAWNADSGVSAPTTIPLTAIFDPSSHYSKTEADARFVAQEAGKGLSANDYTSAEKEKLRGVEAGAQANVIETVKVNDTPLPVVGNEVNVEVPTKPADVGAAPASHSHAQSDVTGLETALAGKAPATNIAKAALAADVQKSLENADKLAARDYPFKTPAAVPGVTGAVQLLDRTMNVVKPAVAATTVPAEWRWNGTATRLIGALGDVTAVFPSTTNKDEILVSSGSGLFSNQPVWVDYTTALDDAEEQGWVVDDVLDAGKMFNEWPAGHSDLNIRVEADGDLASLPSAPSFDGTIEMTSSDEATITITRRNGESLSTPVVFTNCFFNVREGDWFVLWATDNPPAVLGLPEGTYELDISVPASAVLSAAGDRYPFSNATPAGFATASAAGYLGYFQLPENSLSLVGHPSYSANMVSPIKLVLPEAEADAFGNTLTYPRDLVVAYDTSGIAADPGNLDQFEIVAPTGEGLDILTRDGKALPLPELGKIAVYTATEIESGATGANARMYVTQTLLEPPAPAEP